MPQNRVAKKRSQPKGTRHQNAPKRDPFIDELIHGVNEDPGDLSIPDQYEDDYKSPGPLSFSVHPLTIYKSDSPEVAYAKGQEIMRRKALRAKMRQVDAENKRIK